MTENFDNFMNHKRDVKYLQNTSSITLGNGYEFVSSPISPLLKEFTLYFTGFRYYFNDDGSIDYETNKDKNNVGALALFYEQMNMNNMFVYNDSVYGKTMVRFKEPLSLPKTLGPFAVVSDFSVVLTEVTVETEDVGVYQIISELREEIISLGGQIDSLTSENEMLQSQVTSLTSENEVLQGQVTSLTSEISSIESELAQI